MDIVRKAGTFSRLLVQLFVIGLVTVPLVAQRSDGDGPSPLRGSHHLEVVELNVPTWTRNDLPFNVGVTAADDRGIGFVEVIFGTQVFRIPGNGEKRVNGVVTFRPFGLASVDTPPTDSVTPPIDPFVRAVAYSTDGVLPGVPVDRHLLFGPEDRRTGPIDEIALQNYRDMIADSGYAQRTGLVLPTGPNVPTAQSDPRPWWVRWESVGGPTRFNWQRLCSVATPDPALPDLEGQVLNCWLALHPFIRSNIVWEELDPTAGDIDEYGTPAGAVTRIKYQDWTGLMKLQLGEAFFHAYKYLRYGAVSFDGQPLPPYPQNQLTLQDSEAAETIITHDDAWSLYLETIAHSLAVEIGGFVPWSIANYAKSDLAVLFDSSTMVSPKRKGWLVTGTTGRTAVGYFANELIPAPPTTNFAFLLAQDAIQATQISTVGGYLTWARPRTFHIAGSPTGKSTELYWGVRGIPPATAVLSGTIYAPPGWPPSPLRSWVDGCWGQSFTIQQTLRAVNIPVQVFDQTGHTQPVFFTMNRAIDHGDDIAATGEFHATPMYPASAIMIPLPTFDDWFFGAGQIGPGGYENVSRQVEIELPLSYLADELLQRYCSDKATNATHANGTVAAFFVKKGYTFYTVAQLEAQNLWQHLGVKATSLGYCGP